jgi:DNA primase
VAPARYGQTVAIPEEDVARVRAATDIVALIGEHVGLKRQGRRFSGLCPFHQEKTPSFSVNAEEGVYYCFGCQASGDAITFVRSTEHLDFVDAVRLLADKAGITITEDEAFTQENRKRAPLYRVMASAVEWYHERLLTSPDAGRARDYLRSRGYGGDLVRKFKLGWAPDEWDALARHIFSSSKSSGSGAHSSGPNSGTTKLLSDAGLAFVNRTGRTQDAFRARVLFPIFDPSGKAVAIGGRVLPASAGAQAPAMPKYKNSQETAIYSKRRVLYGMNWAKSDVVASGEVIVCEGYTDVIGFFSVGLPRAVATCGTALGEEHFRMLRNFATGRVVLAYDADAAGAEGASRVYTWERQHQVDVAVAALPVGSDPGELARTDPDALRAAVADAKPFLAFRLARIFGSAELKTAEGRAKTADRALATVLEHPSELVRDQYLMEIADRCRMEPSALRARMESGAIEVGTNTTGSKRVGNPSIKVSNARHSGSRQSEESSGPTTTLTDTRPGGPDQSRGERPGRGATSGSHEGSRPGLEALRLAVHDPDRIGERLERFLFIDDLHARTFDALASSDTISQAIAQVDDEDPEVATLLRRLTVEESAADADDCVVQLIRAAAHRSLVALQAEARLEPQRVAEVAADAGQVALDLEQIGTSDAGLEAADRLLAWLHKREMGA